MKKWLYILKFIWTNDFFITHRLSRLAAAVQNVHMNNVIIQTIFFGNACDYLKCKFWQIIRLSRDRIYFENNDSYRLQNEMHSILRIAIHTVESVYLEIFSFNICLKLLNFQFLFKYIRKALQRKDVSHFSMWLNDFPSKSICRYTV